MPVDVKKLREYIAEIPLDVFGERLTIRYKPLEISDPAKRDARTKRYREARARLIERADDEDELPDEDPTVEVTRPHSRLTWAEADKPLVEMACAMLTGWDLTDKGEELPTTLATWKKWKLPPSLAQRIVLSISEDVETLGRLSSPR